MLILVRNTGAGTDAGSDSITDTDADTGTGVGYESLVGFLFWCPLGRVCSLWEGEVCV